MKKTETTSTVLLKHHLKALRLPTIHSECERVAVRCATEMSITWASCYNCASWNW